MNFLFKISLALLLPQCNAFSTLAKLNVQSAGFSRSFPISADRPTQISLYAEPPNSVKERDNTFKADVTPEETERLAKTFGGYTVKQRLREEVESPFRKVRLIFFASSAGSALTALYFSSTSALKAYLGTYADAPPLEDALTSCGINIAGAIVCGALAYRDYNIGQANLERIARGGKLAKLAVSPAFEEKKLRTMSDYRRTSRVLICAGDKQYIEDVCKSMNSDQLGDNNNLPQLIEDVDVVVVPVLLSGSASVGDTKTVWRETVPTEADRNFDSTRSDRVIAFPWNNAAWAEYLKGDIETAEKQGFDVMKKGITLTVKKNGKILRRATGRPRWAELVGTMEVMDGSKFGMPGDSEKYGGP